MTSDAMRSARKHILVQMGKDQEEDGDVIVTEDDVESWVEQVASSGNEVDVDVVKAIVGYSTKNMESDRCNNLTLTDVQLREIEDNFYKSVNLNQSGVEMMHDDSRPPEHSQLNNRRDSSSSSSFSYNVGPCCHGSRTSPSLCPAMNSSSLKDNVAGEYSSVRMRNKHRHLHHRHYNNASVTSPSQQSPLINDERVTVVRRSSSMMSQSNHSLYYAPHKFTLVRGGNKNTNDK